MSSKEKLFEKYVSTGQSGFNHYSSIKWSPYFENVINKNILDKNSNILDIGCGTGSFLFHLKKLGFYNTYGIDISQEQINVAHNYGIQNI
ncbi:MAG: class I SAM-dependent methyltransferase [Saprospiraceae bacterium]|nr:class I SAM-dependent methyltransferase [Saprospiraceae bacterium]